MNFYRETIKNLPPIIQVPDEFRNRDVELIILPLESNGNGRSEERDEMGYPAGFFEATAGALADDPIERWPQGHFEVREEIK